MMPKQMECTVTSPYYYKEIPAMGYETVTMEVDCPRIKKLEHVSYGITVLLGYRDNCFVDRPSINWRVGVMSKCIIPTE